MALVGVELETLVFRTRRADHCIIDNGASRRRSICIIDDGASRRRTRISRFRARRADHSTTASN